MPHCYKLVGHYAGKAYLINPMTDDLGPLCRDLPERLWELPVRWNYDIYFAIATAKEICRHGDVPDGSASKHRFDKIDVRRLDDGSRVAWTDGKLLWKDKPE